MCRIKFGVVLSAIAALVCQSGVVQAAAISVNMSVNGGPSCQVGSNSAGVVSVGNWNDVKFDSTNFVTVPVSDQPLVDSNGNSSGMTISIPSTTWTNSAAAFSDAGNQSMMYSHVYAAAGSTVDLNFSGSVPYDTFDVYIYYLSGQMPFDNTQTFSILNGSGTVIASQGGLEAYTDANRLTGFERSTGAYAPGNYVKLSGLTSADLGNTFSIQASATSGYCYINGMQFAEPVPEPASMCVLVTGAISLLAYAWRKRRIAA